MPATNPSGDDVDVDAAAKLVHDGGRSADTAGVVVLFDDDDTEHGYVAVHDIELDDDLATEFEFESTVDVLVHHDDAVGQHVVVFLDDLFAPEVAKRL